MAKKKGGLVSPAFQALLHNLLSQYVKCQSQHTQQNMKRKPAKVIGLQKYDFFSILLQWRLKLVFR